LFLIILQLCLVGVLVFSLAGYLGRWHKYAELASHFKTQYLIASIACLLASLVIQEYVWTAVAAFAGAINLGAVVPGYLGRKKLPAGGAGGKRLKLLFANVNFKNTSYESFLAFVQRQSPDVLVVQEVDSRWCNSLLALRPLYPFSESLPKGGGSGIALYSRLRFDLLKVELCEGSARPAILARMEMEEASVSLLTFHPRAPIRKGHFELRNRMMVSAVDCLRGLPDPKICVADLNITPWSPYFRSFAKQTGLASVRKGFGVLPSWPVFMKFRWLMIPLDHCLVSNGVSVTDVRIGEPFGSDHLPLIVELEIHPISERG